MSAGTTTFDPTELLLHQLQQARNNLILNLEDLDEYDVRRPMTPSGTNIYTTGADMYALATESP